MSNRSPAVDRAAYAKRRHRILDFLSDPYEAIEPGRAVYEIAEALLEDQDRVCYAIKQMVREGTLGAERVQNAWSPKAYHKLWRIE